MLGLGCSSNKVMWLCLLWRCVKHLPIRYATDFRSTLTRPPSKVESISFRNWSFQIGFWIVAGSEWIVLTMSSSAQLFANQSTLYK